MSLDLDTTRAAFAQSTDFTVGIEEEFALLDVETLELVPRYEELREAASADPVLADSVAGELISSEIEIRSGRGRDLHAAIAAQRVARQRLFAIAAQQRIALGSTGTHPFSDYRAQQIIDTDHYRRVEHELQYVARRNNTFALHVHVGIRDADRAVGVCDRLRPILPVLLAVSANSPFLDGGDSGLHSARTQIFTKSFPRCGVPDPYGDWRTFSDYVELLVATNSIVEYTQVWWSVRPHLSFGTVEVRISDAQATAMESEALTAMTVAAVAQAARDIDEGRPFVDPPARLIEENMWRAIRFGLDGCLLDLEHCNEYPAGEAIERLASWTAPVRSELGIDLVWPSKPNGAQRQRRMVEAGVPTREIYAAVVNETRASYAERVPA